MQKFVKIISSDDDPSDALAQYADAGWRVVEIVPTADADEYSASFEWTVLLQNDSGDADATDLDEILKTTQNKNSVKNTVVTAIISALCIALIVIISLALKKFL